MHAIPEMSPEDILLSEISQTQKNKRCVLPHLSVVSLTVAESTIEVKGSTGNREPEPVCKGRHSISVWECDKVLETQVLMFSAAKSSTEKWFR